MPATAIDIRQMIAMQLDKARELFNIDLKYLSDEQIKTSPGGKCRAPIAFIQECAGFNFLVAKALGGEEPKMPSEEQMTAFQAAHDTHGKVSAALNESVDAVIAALKAVDPSQLDRMVTAPWGAQVSVLELTITAVQHLFYHDGQLNYFQAYHGDADYHWAEVPH